MKPQELRVIALLLSILAAYFFFLATFGAHPDDVKWFNQLTYLQKYFVERVGFYAFLLGTLVSAIVTLLLVAAALSKNNSVTSNSNPEKTEKQN